MTEPQTKIEYATPKVSPGTSSAMKEAVTEGHRLIDGIAAKGEDVTLNELLGKIYEWENKFGDRVQGNEIEALQATSYMLGTVDYFITHEASDPKAARLQSITTQRDFLRMVFSNLDKEGRPQEGTSKIFGLITYVFEKFFINKDLVADARSGLEAGLWQGTMGMVTAGFLFKEAGWKVAFADPKLDMYCDCDFLAENPQGQVYSVDVTAKGVEYDKDGGRKQPFRVSQEKVSHAVDRQYSQIAGNIRVNVPPIWHLEADAFYEDRRSGFPKPEIVEKFKKLVET